jgi:hypothetical protein
MLRGVLRRDASAGRSAVKIDVLRHAIAAVDDGHVMRETLAPLAPLAPLENFDGERTYVDAPKAN